MKRLQLLLLSLALASCSAAEEGPGILYDPCEPTAIVAAEDTTARERASIDAALTLWADVGLAGLGRAHGPGAQEIAIRFEDAAPLFFGVYEPEQGSVVVNRSLDDPGWWTITVAHELGHAFGLTHVSPDARLSVMNAGNLTVMPTRDDVAAMMRLWGPCPGP